MMNCGPIPAYDLHGMLDHLLRLRIDVACRLIQYEHLRIEHQARANEISCRSPRDSVDGS